MNEKLDAALRQWSAETESGPPPSVERAVLAEFERTLKARRRRQWIAGVASVAAAVAVVVWTGDQRPVEVVESPPAAQDPFTALPYVVQPARYERTEVVRMTVPVAELIAAGLSLRGDPGTAVEAEFVIGQDGRARAVRLVESFE